MPEPLRLDRVPLTIRIDRADLLELQKLLAPGQRNIIFECMVKRFIEHLKKDRAGTFARYDIIIEKALRNILEKEPPSGSV